MDPTFEVTPEVLDPSMLPLDDGGLMVDPSGAAIMLQPLMQAMPKHADNLAAFLDEHTLNQIGLQVKEATDEDFETCAEMRDRLKDGIRLLGMSEDGEALMEGVRKISHPVLLEIVTKAHNKAYAELFPSGGPVRTKINKAVSDPALEAKAANVKAYMNWQLTEQMEEYETDLDRMLFYVFYAGNAFRKLTYDAHLSRPRAQFLTLDEFVINANFNSIAEADRYGHKFKMSYRELRKSQLNGTYLDIDLSSVPVEDASTFSSAINEEVLNIQIATGERRDSYELVEHYCYLDLPGFEHLDQNGNPSGLALPYIVTIDYASGKVLSIYRNWREGDPTYQRWENIVHYGFLPGVGLLCFGYLHLIGGLTESVNATLRTLVTAGVLSNHPGGFVSKNVKITNGNGIFRLGEWRRIETYGAPINQVFSPLPVKEPSQVLLALHNNLVDLAKRYSGTAEELVDKAATYGPVGTILALLEQSEAPYATIHKRLHRAQAKELKLLAEINYRTLPMSEFVPYGTYGAKISAEDFDGVQVVPVSNPNIPASSHRLAIARAQLEIGMQAPQFHNLPDLIRQVHTVINPDTVDIIMAKPPAPTPLDPLSEIQAVIAGQPVKAFPEQPHDLHVSIISTFLEDPRYGGALDEPKKQALQALMLDHLGWRMRQEVELVLGQPLPPPGQQLPPEVSYRITEAAALALKSIQLAGQESLPPDPAEQKAAIDAEKLDVKREELDMKRDLAEQELEFKRTKLAVDSAIAMDKLEKTT